MTSPKRIVPLKVICICGDIVCDIPHGYCHCRCGGLAPVAKKTYPEYRKFRGRPQMFINFHSAPRRKEDAAPFKIDGEYCRLIELTQGYHAIVSAHRYEYLSRINWAALKTRYGVRPVRSVRTKNDDGSISGRYIYMYRLIVFGEEEHLEPQINFDTDHRNGCALDNRDSNLRPATNTQNSKNQKLRTDSTSGYKGVTWNKKDKAWLCQMVIDGRTQIPYRGPDKIAAAKIYDYYARMCFGEFACVNFPRLGERSAR